VEHIRRKLSAGSLDAVFAFARYEVGAIVAALEVPGTRLVSIQGTPIDKLELCLIRFLNGGACIPHYARYASMMRLVRRLLCIRGGAVLPAARIIEVR
jgi:hypothetical protein